MNDSVLTWQLQQLLVWTPPQLIHPVKPYVSPKKELYEVID